MSQREYRDSGRHDPNFRKNLKAKWVEKDTPIPYCQHCGQWVFVDERESEAACTACGRIIEVIPETVNA